MLHVLYSDLSGPHFSTDPQLRLLPRSTEAGRLPAASRSTSTGLNSLRRSPDMALEAMVHELHNAALQTCVVASWANGIANRSSSTAPQSVETFLPRDPGVFLTLSRWERDTAISHEALASADAFFRSLPPARRSFERFKKEALEIGLPRAAALNQCVIVDSWRAACIGGLAALDDLGEDLQAEISERHLQTGRILFALLTSCRNGMSPCLDETGTPYLPELPQRRRERRFALLENCFVATPRETMSAYARDISEGGIGLERVGNLEAGAFVRIHLPIGRVFEGHVAWVRRGSAGIKFLEPLRTGDPLIAD